MEHTCCYLTGDTERTTLMFLKIDPEVVVVVGGVGSLHVETPLYHKKIF